MNELKNILIFTKEYHHENISKSGGTGVFYKNLANKLNELGYNVYVFGSSKKPASFLEDGITFHFVKDYFKKHFFWEFLRSLSKKSTFLENFNYKIYLLEKKYLLKELKKFSLSKKINFDIIETHDWDGISLNLNELNIPYAVRYHGSWSVLEKHFGYPSVPKGKLICEKKAAENSKNNITISKYSQTINCEIFNIKNPNLIYNGIDSSLFCPEKEGKIIPKSIFYLGNITEEKGADVALEAFMKIKLDNPESKLHFIGNEGGYKKVLQEKAKNLESDIIFHGRKNTKEIIELLSKAEIIFFPSKGENFSLSLLEAMSLEKAVICSALPSFKEIIKEGENGMIANNATEFSEKAKKIFNEPELRKFLEKNARQTILENFDINKMVKETINYYRMIYEKF